ncbi:hypothetical protein APHCRT_0558 [Anaplasma phagocytophilum str. CRT53-1]|uniref:Uncharacterized protein n=1 Tax=Anaplasma phagocytophilum str. CRT53-1 TaxID=1359157 RepID=A0A0F3Q198_ANAPH|nr:hypothetical protein APHCRT_0558 [Anaplasma phagocytophilum str. CRT53-1]
MAVRVWHMLKKIMRCKSNNMDMHCGIIPCAYHYSPNSEL